MLSPNDQAGPYTLVKFLGEGAFGQVWLAEKTTPLGTRLRVALKLLNLQLVDLDAIREEAAVWETLKHHPHIVTLVDVDKYTVNGTEYVGIASLYHEDGSLNDWLKRHGGRAPSTQAAVEMTLGILDGLACLHEQTPPVIHRDLKPANILMQGQRPLLADFGLARALRSGKDYSHSRHGAGTLPYMAPESFDAEHSFRTDIWSVGVMLYQMLGGRLPFNQRDQPSLIKAIIMDDPPPLPSSVPAEMHRIVAKSLAKDKTQRYQNVEALSADLRAFLTGSTAQTQVDPDKTAIDPDAERHAAEEAERQRRQAQPFVASPAKPLWPKLLVGAALLGVVWLVYALAWRSSGGSVQTSNSGSNTTMPVATAVESDKTPAVSTATTPFDKATMTAMLPGNVKMEFVLIPAGNFMMGSPQSEQGRFDIEGPQHDVTISHEFYLSRYEVTQAQWVAVMGKLPDKCFIGGMTSKFVGDDEPIICVSWDNAQQFIQKLNAQSSSGGKYRLPTEAEWEYAARAGTTGPYAGNLDEMGWYGGNSGGKIHPVGQKKANKFGLYDMHGNVWEWVQDWYGPYSDSAVTDPSGPATSSSRMIRGSNWGNVAVDCRLAARHGHPPDYRLTYLGFRLARTPA